jgi:hypothetical protein
MHKEPTLFDFVWIYTKSAGIIVAVIMFGIMLWASPLLFIIMAGLVLVLLTYGLLSWLVNRKK